MGLDQPAWVQYWRYISGVVHGDLGESASTGRPVLEDFMQRLPATLELTLASLMIALVLGIPLGVQSAVHRDTAIDHIGRIVGVAGVAMPTFWTGLLSLYVFFYLLGVAPPPLGRLGAGIAPPHGDHRPLRRRQPADRQLDGAAARRCISSMLPAFTLGLSVMAPIARMVRSTMLEILESDYIKAAWAAGLPRRRVIYGDALAQRPDPVVTILGIVFGFLMAGNAVVESVFAWPGIGNYADHLADDQGFRPDPVVRAVRRRALRHRQLRDRHRLRPDRSAHPARLMADVARSPIAPLGPTPATLRLVWRRLRRNWLSAIALGLIVVMIAGGRAAPAGSRPTSRTRPIAAAALQAPSLASLARHRHLRPRPALAHHLSPRGSTSPWPSAPPRWRW